MAPLQDLPAERHAGTSICMQKQHTSNDSPNLLLPHSCWVLADPINANIQFKGKIVQESIKLVGVLQTLQIHKTDNQA